MKSLLLAYSAPSLSLLKKLQRDLRIAQRSNHPHKRVISVNEPETTNIMRIQTPRHCFLFQPDSCKLDAWFV
jgi:hypothetical protein